MDDDLKRGPESDGIGKVGFESAQSDRAFMEARWKTSIEAIL
jgi:hypothetical protein